VVSTGDRFRILFILLTLLAILSSECILNFSLRFMKAFKEKEYGQCTVYTCMKIEQLNQLKLF
jgi:hypothetical protein